MRSEINYRAPQKLTQILIMILLCRHCRNEPISRLHLAPFEINLFSIKLSVGRKS